MWSTFIHLRLVLSCYPLSLWQWSLNWNNTLVLQAAVEVSEKSLTSMEWFPTFLHLPRMKRVAHLRICIFLLCHSVNAGVSCEDIIRCLWFVLACFRVLDLEHRQLRPKLGMFLMKWNVFFTRLQWNGLKMGLHLCTDLAGVTVYIPYILRPLLFRATLVT